MTSPNSPKRGARLSGLMGYDDSPSLGDDALRTMNRDYPATTFRDHNHDSGAAASWPAAPSWPIGAQTGSARGGRTAGTCTARLNDKNKGLAAGGGSGEYTLLIRGAVGVCPRSVDPAAFHTPPELLEWDRSKAEPDPKNSQFTVARPRGQRPGSFPSRSVRVPAVVSPSWPVL